MQTAARHRSRPNVSSGQARWARFTAFATSPLFRSSISALLARASGVISGVVQLGLAARVLGPQHFGNTVTVTSVVAALVVVDMGSSNYTVSRIAEAEARGSSAGVWTYTLALKAKLKQLFIGFLLVTALAASILAASARFAIGNWEWSLLLIALVAVGAQLRGLIGKSLLQGTHRYDVLNTWALGGTLVGATLTGILFYVQAPPVTMAASVIAVPHLISALMAVRVERAFRHERAMSQVDLEGLLPRAVGVRASSDYFLISAAGAVTQNFDLLAISLILTARQAAVYALVSRPFLAVQNVIALAIGPLWPMATRARVSGQLSNFSKQLMRSFVTVNLLAICVSAVLIVSIHWILRVWANYNLAGNTSLAYLWATFTLVTINSTLLSNSLIGLNGQRSVARIGILTAGVNLLLTVVLARVFSIDGPVLASIISIGLLTLPTLVWKIRRALWEDA